MSGHLDHEHVDNIPVMARRLVLAFLDNNLVDDDLPAASMVLDEVFKPRCCEQCLVELFGEMTNIAVQGHQRLAVMFCALYDHDYDPAPDVWNAKAAKLAARDLAETLDDRSAS